MHRLLTFAALLGLVSLSLLTFSTPAEACWRSRHRQQYVPVCAADACGQPACMGQGCGCPTSAKLCLYCDGKYWQQATDGQPCVMMDSSYLGTDCGYLSEMTKGAPGTYRVLRGYDLWYNANTGLWTWYSDLKSSAYCDVSYVHHCGPKYFVRAISSGTCANGVPYWDIYVKV
jgi:hypothetical protein